LLLLFHIIRSVKIWSVDDRSYVETLFGHNDKISAVDAGTRERAVTAGTVLK
jgi:ribosomal RNA-processing protein 9